VLFPPKKDEHSDGQRLVKTGRNAAKALQEGARLLQNDLTEFFRYKKKEELWSSRFRSMSVS
jgi:hypothetical protein